MSEPQVQSIIPEEVISGDALPLMELFYTLQGEGAYAGAAAVFIRLGGCDVGCHWCDVKESWDANAHPIITVGDMVAQAAAFPARIAVITGGEPLMYPLDKLIDGLQVEGFRVHIETSGSSPLSGKPDWITLSPKKFKAPLAAVYPLADELKIVVFNESDFKWAEQHRIRVGENCLLLLQPEWGRHEKMQPRIIEYIQSHPQWRLSLQTHKYVGIP